MDDTFRSGYFVYWFKFNKMISFLTTVDYKVLQLGATGGGKGVTAQYYCKPPPTHLSAHIPPLAHARIRTHPGPPNSGQSKRSLDDLKAKRHISRASCPIKRPHGSEKVSW